MLFLMSNHWCQSTEGNGEYISEWKCKMVVIMSQYCGKCWCISGQMKKVLFDHLPWFCVLSTTAIVCWHYLGLNTCIDVWQWLKFIRLQLLHIFFYLMCNISTEMHQAYIGINLAPFCFYWSYVSSSIFSACLVSGWVRIPFASV